MRQRSSTRAALAAALTVLMVVLAAPALAGVPAVRPVDGPVVSAFAPPAGQYGAGHRGVDLAAVPGERVRVALAGTVAFAGQVAGARWVTVDHGGGLATTYGVLAAPQVRAGQRVAAGDVIGVLADGADHLDWGALRDDAYLDPLTLLGTWAAHLVDPERLEARLATARAATAAPAHGLLWPVAGRVSSGFGWRTHPVSGQPRLHAGVDLAAPLGTPVVAAAAGTVTWAGARGGYGLLVVIDHGGGLQTRYAHCSAIDVRPGEHVAQGQLLARVGATGTATGPHLHLEIRVGGVARDPLGALPSTT